VVTLVPAGIAFASRRSGRTASRDLPGFDHDDTERLSTCDVRRDEAVAAARTALDAHGVDAGGPPLIHLGA
jgi:hypothetical protein